MKRMICRAMIGAVLTAVMTAMVQGLLAWSANSPNFEQDWDPQFYAATTSLASSTHAVTGVGFSWAINSLSTCSLTIYYTTKTYYAGNINSSTLAPAVVVSSAIFIPANQPISNVFRTLTYNPRLVINGLANSSTAYVYIDYGTNKR